MEACADVQPKLPDRPGNRLRTPYSARRSVEAREEPVAGRVELAPAEAIELSTHERVVRGNELRPAPVADLRRALGRADDVREEHRRQDGVRLGRSPDGLHEALDLVVDAGGEDERDVQARNLDPARP